MLPTSLKGKGKGAASIYGDRSVMQSLTSQRKKPLTTGKQGKGKRSQPGQGVKAQQAMDPMQAQIQAQAAQYSMLN